MGMTKEKPPHLLGLFCMRLPLFLIFFVCLLSFCPPPQYNIFLIRDQRDKHTQTEIYSLKKSIGWINSCPCKVLGLRSSTITENWLCQQDSKNTEENNNNKKHKISRLGKQRLLLRKQQHRTLVPRGRRRAGERRQLVQESPGATPQKRPSGLFLAAPLFNTSHLPSLLSCQSQRSLAKHVHVFP